tara:strand:- start:564 stop:758 length:195 start_codon:yes stop_codon:yes gene_type:complete
MKVKDFLKQIEEMGLTGEDEISFEVEHMIKMIKLPQKETETTLKETIENIVNTKGVNKEHGELE